MFHHFCMEYTIYFTNSLWFGFDNDIIFCSDLLYINYVGIVNNKKSAFYKLFIHIIKLEQ